MDYSKFHVLTAYCLNSETNQIERVTLPRESLDDCKNFKYLYSLEDYIWGRNYDDCDDIDSYSLDWLDYSHGVYGCKVDGVDLDDVLGTFLWAFCDQWETLEEVNEVAKFLAEVIDRGQLEELVNVVNCCDELSFFGNNGLEYSRFAEQFENGCYRYNDIDEEELGRETIELLYGSIVTEDNFLSDVIDYKEAGRRIAMESVNGEFIDVPNLGRVWFEWDC